MPPQRRTALAALCCGSAAALVCRPCQAARFCGREHQKQAWPGHKAWCQFLSRSNASGYTGRPDDPFEEDESEVVAQG